MSNHSVTPPSGGREIQPHDLRHGSERRQGKTLKGLGAAAGLGLLILLPGAAVADGYSYGSAELTLGFPNATVSVGRTWENRPREVIVERVTHKLPETDFDEETEEYSEADVIEEEAPEEEQIIIEKRRPRVARKVTIIERYEEPSYCERETVVRKVYVEPPCDRTEVVYHSAPRRVVYVPSPTVVVHSPHRVHEVVRVRGGGHGHHRYRGGHGHGGHGGHGGAIRVRQEGPRNLFPEGGGRPMRSRGSRNLVMVGANGHSH
jgi:hypothetical protein